ncbi:MmgE/PrpD family protein [Mongoliimonas terrestris]|uniref:MmgE/PrpD family protein n=1 Tax=Mongoliimonas terrestris TaxID=1709001 RepID=UPI000A7AC3BC|nr:MmgE/PrpD family protein [Mongoliimonas terrestris]
MKEDKTQAVSYGAAELDLGLTMALSRFVADLDFNDLSAGTVHAAKRGVMDWLGCALAGSRHATLDRLLPVLAMLSGDARFPVVGRPTRLGLLESAMANGQMGHVLDFDDTHMGGVVLHASSPLLAALLAVAEARPVDGRTLLAAYVAGFDVAVRAGQGAPGHHRGGWHLTGTLGTIGAGAAVARLLGLDARQTAYAVGIATTQAAGMQQNRGTMCKSFHAGKAAANGALAGLLAEGGFDSSLEILEGRKGFCRIFSDTAAPETLLDGLGSRFEIERNGFKPYACGIVLHPTIDAMVAIGRRIPDKASVREIALRVHPHAVSITGVADPKTGLKSKFSLTHSAAVACLDGAAGIEQYGDARAAAPDVIALRERVSVETDDSLGKDQAFARVTLAGGDVLEQAVTHATGTVDNPMSDGALEEKFLANARPVVGDGADRLADAVWGLDRMEDVRGLLQQAAGTGG